MKLPGVKQLFSGAILIAALAVTISPVADPDFFWHVKVGQWIIDNGRIPTHDLFTYTVSDHPFVAHEWLSEVIMAAISSSLGLWGIVVLYGGLTWAAFVLLWRTARGVNFVIAALALVLGMAAGNAIWGPRAQMITFAFCVLLLFLLRRYRETGDRRRLFPLPFLFIAWVNLHAGFTIGLVFIAIYIAGETIEWALNRSRPNPVKPLLAVLVACSAAVAVNPNFVNIYLYAVQTQFSPAQQRVIVEWFSPDFHQLTMVGAYELMLLGLLFLFALVQRRPRVTDLLLLLAGVTLSLQSVRHIVLFVAIATPIVAEQAQALWEMARARGLRPHEPPNTRVFGVANLTILLLIAVVVAAVKAPVFVAGPRSAAIKKDFPVLAVDHLLAALPPGHVMNRYEWGGYLVYRAWPGQKVFIYGDAAVMGDAFLSEYEAIENLHQNHLELLKARQVSWVIDRTSAPLTVVLSQSPDWRVVYRDDLATVLVRVSSETQAYLDAHPNGL